MRGVVFVVFMCFMVLDVKFCEDYFKLIFICFKVEFDKGICFVFFVVFGDLAFRFFNVVESWIEYLYGIKEWGNLLYDIDVSV